MLLMLLQISSLLHHVRELSLRRGKMWTTTHAFIGAPPKEAIRPFVQQNALGEEWRCNEQVAKMIVAFVKGTFAVEFCLLFALRCFFLPNEQLRSWVATKLREISSQQFAKLALKLKWPRKQSIFLLNSFFVVDIEVKMKLSLIPLKLLLT